MQKEVNKELDEYDDIIKEIATYLFLAVPTLEEFEELRNNVKRAYIKVLSFLITLKKFGYRVRDETIEYAKTDPSVVLNAIAVATAARMMIEANNEDVGKAG